MERIKIGPKGGIVRDRRIERSKSGDAISKFRQDKKEAV